MSTTTLSTKGQLVIPSRFRQALHLQPGDRVSIRLEGETLLVQRETSESARLVKEKGRKVLTAPRGAPPMTPAQVKAILADFP
jgi:AbrB family looped-hinge helix DNA binding protein